MYMILCKSQSPPALKRVGSLKGAVWKPLREIMCTVTTIRRNFRHVDPLRSPPLLDPLVKGKWHSSRVGETSSACQVAIWKWNCCNFTFRKDIPASELLGQMVEQAGGVQGEAVTV